MKHIPYATTAKELASAAWGRHFHSEVEAKKEMLKSVDLSGACLMAIVHRIESFVSVVGKEEIANACKSLAQNMDLSLNHFINERELEHGPCPPEVLNYFKSEMYWRVGRHVIECGSVPHNVWVPPLPDKGTDARRLYDKWMRKKIAKKP